jgi:hypothetical protein
MRPGAPDYLAVPVPMPARSTDAGPAPRLLIARGEVVMLGTCLRTGLSVAAVAVSLQVPAEPRYWTLVGVQLEDGAVVTGYFAFDDAARTFPDFNLRVSTGAGPFMPWTFVPGNSGTVWPGLYVTSYLPSVLPGFPLRSLVIRPSGALDGSSHSVSIIGPTSNDLFEYRDYANA